MVTWSVKASDERPPTARHDLVTDGRTAGGPVTRPVFDATAGAPRPHAVVARDALTGGQRVEGPAVIVERETSDALTVTAQHVADTLRTLWVDVEPDATQGRTVEVPVVYGGSGGEDLEGWAEHCGLPPEEAVRRHAAGHDAVAAIGAMPGFPYLSGLDPALARPRRSSPRAVVPEGAVIVGGAQAGIMSQTAPSGWHVLGRTEVKLFDPDAEQPSLLRPGDAVRFLIAGIAR